MPRLETDIGLKRYCHKLYMNVHMCCIYFKKRVQERDSTKAADFGGQRVMQQYFESCALDDRKRCGQSF